MSEPQKINPSKIYLSARLNNYLRFMVKYPITFIEAPSGWGKLSCVREYFHRSSIKPSRIFWTTFPDSTPGQCWAEISSALTQIDPVFSKRNSILPPPYDSETAGKFISEITRMKVTEDYYIIIDSVNFLNSIFRDKMSMEIMRSFNPKIHMIILADYISREHRSSIAMLAFHYITKDELALDRDEIIDYFSYCGIETDANRAADIYTKTNGQLLMLSMYAHYYADHGIFPECSGLFDLIQAAYWDKLTGEMCLILYSVHRFEWFVASQARYIIFSNPLIAATSLHRYNAEIDFTLDEDDVQALMPKITAAIPLIKLDGKKRKYYIHDILKSFIVEKFDGLYPDIKFAIMRQTGNWYANDGNLLNAIKCYYYVRDYKSIRSMDLHSFIIPFAQVNREREFFTELIMNYPVELTRENLCIYIFLCSFLFTLNETDMQSEIYAHIAKLLQQSKLDDESKGAVRSMLTFYGIFAQFNDIEKMRLCIMKSREMNENLHGVIIPFFPWSMNTPSIFYVYHSRIGNADKELNCAKQIQQNYIRLTGQKETGAVSVFHAELQMQRGLFTESIASAGHALAVSSRAGRTYIQICAHLCTARCALFTGDFKSYIRSVKEIKNIYRRFSNPDVKELCEYSTSVLECITRTAPEIPLWLQRGEAKSRSTHCINIAYINMIFGRYLIAEKCYNRYLTIHDSVMFQAETQRLILPRIYFNIYACICYAKLGDTTQALIYMRNALDMSLPDTLYLPLAENYMLCSTVIDGFRQYEKYTEFIDKVKILSGKLERGTTIIKSALLSQSTETAIDQRMEQAIKEIKTMPEVITENPLGLAPREYEVARLAASRMSNRAIADELYISESNVKYIMKLVFSKLGIKSRFELMRYFQ